MDKQIQYLQTCLPAAEKAGGTYDMNPVVILAQGALESGWGTSHLARNIITISVSWGTGHQRLLAWRAGEGGRGRQGALFPSLCRCRVLIP